MFFTCPSIGFTIGVVVHEYALNSVLVICSCLDVGAFGAIGSITKNNSCAPLVKSSDYGSYTLL